MTDRRPLAPGHRSYASAANRYARRRSRASIISVAVNKSRLPRRSPTPRTAPPPPAGIYCAHTALTPFRAFTDPLLNRSLQLLVHLYHRNAAIYGPGEFPGIFNPAGKTVFEFRYAAIPVGFFALPGSAVTARCYSVPIGAVIFRYCDVKRLFRRSFTQLSSRGGGTPRTILLAAREGLR